MLSRRPQLVSPVPTGFAALVFVLLVLGRHARSAYARGLHLPVAATSIWDLPERAESCEAVAMADA
jgi:hypothetical protein